MLTLRTFALVSVLVATGALTACRAADPAPLMAPKIVFLDRSGRAVDLPAPAAHALRELLDRAPSRRVLEGAPAMPPIGTFRVAGKDRSTDFEYHGRFVLLRPAAPAAGGIWEDALLERWYERYRRNNYTASADIFSD